MGRGGGSESGKMSWHHFVGNVEMVDGQRYHIYRTHDSSSVHVQITEIASQLTANTAGSHGSSVCASGDHPHQESNEQRVSTKNSKLKAILWHAKKNGRSSARRRHLATPPVHGRRRRKRSPPRNRNYAHHADVWAI